MNRLNQIVLPKQFLHKAMKKEYAFNKMRRRPPVVRDQHGFLILNPDFTRNAVQESKKILPE